MNPYSGLNFFQFFPVFFGRLFKIMNGAELASDEIQIFVLGLISIAAALIGTLLVLKRMSMLANSLSHTILLGIVVAYLLFASRAGEELGMNFSILIAAALVTGILTTVLTQFLNHVVKLQEDASIGLVFTTLFALGIILVTLYTRNAHIGLEVVMGNPDALHLNDLKIALGVALTNVLFIVLFFKEWKLVCFDQGLAVSLGVRPALYNYLLMLLTSATAISAFRAVGVLLFLAFLVGLPLTARLLTHNLRTMMLLSCGFGLLCSLFAVALARHFLTVYRAPLSTAGMVVVMIGLSFVVALLCRTFSTQRRQSAKTQ